MKEDAWDLRLIDFGASILPDEHSIHADIVMNPLSYIHYLLSHWNLQGYRYGYRDDVYKTLWMGASLIHGDPYTLYFKSLGAAHPDLLVAFKETEFIFHYPGGGDMFRSVPQATRAQREAIVKHLNDALTLARSVNTVHELPAHGAIYGHLNYVYSILSTIV